MRWPSIPASWPSPPAALGTQGGVLSTVRTPRDGATGCAVACYRLPSVHSCAHSLLSGLGCAGLGVCGSGSC
eukprot:1788874-Alexandrium_andersonii.AAC.1